MSNKQESCAVTRNHVMPRYLPHHYSTWNFGMILMEQISASSCHPVAKTLG